jgi:D-glycero-alpha-D-manno-heptose-7-phosphate kinase
MIISKTPFRMSFLGGGSDLPSFYGRSPGAVLSVTINKYVYITVNEKFDREIRLSYSETENVNTVEMIRHPIVREALKMLSIPGGMEITSIADIPSKGTGLGSSSSFTTGLLNALHVYKKEFASPEMLAREACEIEIDIMEKPIGKQDQYAAAYGGLNLIQFYEDGSVGVDPIICLKETRKSLEQNILMFYTGISRSAEIILGEQNQNIISDNKKYEILKKMVQLTHLLRKELQNNNLNAFGEILHENWVLKRELASGISNPSIDEWYETGRKYGALGGKILGAGGGGFLIFYAPQEKHEQIIRMLPQLRPIPFRFEYQGCKIIFIH